MKIHKIFLAILIITIFAATSRAQVNAASCSEADVQTAINSATQGQTVNIPACPAGVSWTGSGDTISGKGIIISGAGAGRVIAVDIETTAITIGNGTKTFNFVTNDQGATAYLTNAALSISNGQTLRIIENGWLGNFMQGTVTSFSGGVLVMNITSSGGTCGQTIANAMSSNCKRWLVSTIGQTVINNNLTSGAMFTVTEDTSVHTTFTGIHFGQGASGGGTGSAIQIIRNNPSGVAVLGHDNFFESNQADIIDSNSNRGVFWNISFVFSPFSTGQFAFVRIKDGNNTAMPTSWSSASTMGMADTTGQNNFYVETSDCHAVGAGTDWDDNARAVLRYMLLDNCALSSHGADTSAIGMRHFEAYNNVGIFESYGDGTTANLANGWMFWRGGTGVIHDNTLPVISSQDWGAKGDFGLAVLTLQRADQYPCWGSGFSTPGQFYPAPRQIGFGFITGNGTVNYPAGGFNNASTAGGVYVGDIEPIYFYNNNRTLNVNPADNGNQGCNAATMDSAVNYVQAGRDFFNNGTAKPGYTPFTYPHPLTGSSPASPPPPASVPQIFTLNGTWTAVPLPPAPPAPILSGTSPSKSYVNSSGQVSQDGKTFGPLTLKFLGSNFAAGPAATFDGKAVMATFVNSNEIDVTVPAAMVGLPSGSPVAHAIVVSISQPAAPAVPVLN